MVSQRRAYLIEAWRRRFCLNGKVRADLLGGVVGGSGLCQFEPVSFEPCDVIRVRANAETRCGTCYYVTVTNGHRGAETG
jgi:hypothetical protein